MTYYCHHYYHYHCSCSSYSDNDDFVFGSSLHSHHSIHHHHCHHCHQYLHHYHYYYYRYHDCSLFSDWWSTYYSSRTTEFAGGKSCERRRSGIEWQMATGTVGVRWETSGRAVGNTGGADGSVSNRKWQMSSTGWTEPHWSVWHENSNPRTVVWCDSMWHVVSRNCATVCSANGRTTWYQCTVVCCGRVRMSMLKRLKRLKLVFPWFHNNFFLDEKFVENFVCGGDDCLSTERWKVRVCRRVNAYQSTWERRDRSTRRLNGDPRVVGWTTVMHHRTDHCCTRKTFCKWTNSGWWWPVSDTGTWEWDRWHRGADRWESSLLMLIWKKYLKLDDGRYRCWCCRDDRTIVDDGWEKRKRSCYVIDYVIDNVVWVVWVSLCLPRRISES